MKMELTVVVIVWAVAYFYLCHCLARIEKEADDLKKQVKSLQSREESRYMSITMLSEMAVESRVRLYKLENPEPTPKHIAEDVLVALGGTVDRCFDKDGRLKSITIKAPWMKEPAVYVNHMSGDYAGLKFDEEPMAQRWCEDALRQLTAKLAEKKAKK